MKHYRTITHKLAAGEVKEVSAREFLTLVSASQGNGSLGLALLGSTDFGAFVARMVIGDEGGGPIGKVLIKNLSLNPNDVVLLTSDRRMALMDVTGSAVTIAGATIDVPIKYQGAEGNSIDGDAPKASGVMPVEAYGMMYNGATWDRVRGTIAKGVLVDTSANVGNSADAAATTDTGTFSLIALFKRLFSKLPAALGQTTKSGSLSVTIASDQGNLPTNVAQINGVTPLMGNGTTGTGSLRVTLASDGTAISTAGFMSVKLDQTTDGSTNAMVDKPSTTSAAALSATLMAGMTTNVVKASAGNLYGFSVINKDAAVLYLQGYNQTTAPTRGTGVVWWCPIKASDVVTIISNKPLFQFSTGIGFSSATTPTGAVAPTTAPDVVAYYK